MAVLKRELIISWEKSVGEIEKAHKRFSTENMLRAIIWYHAALPVNSFPSVAAAQCLEIHEGHTGALRRRWKVDQGSSPGNGPKRWRRSAAEKKVRTTMTKMLVLKEGQEPEFILTRKILMDPCFLDRNLSRMKCASGSNILWTSSPCKLHIGVAQDEGTSGHFFKLPEEPQSIPFRQSRCEPWSEIVISVLVMVLKVIYEWFMITVGNNI